MLKGKEVECDLPDRFIGGRSLPDFIEYLKEHWEELDAKFEPGESISLRVKHLGTGKSFLQNNGNPCFTSFREVAAYFRHPPHYEVVTGFLLLKYENLREA